MSQRTERSEHQTSLAAWLQQRTAGPSSTLLGATCLVLGVVCLGVTFWNGDLAVQSGAVLLGVSLGASGIIAFLAGDR